MQKKLQKTLGHVNVKFTGFHLLMWYAYAFVIFLRFEDQYKKSHSYTTSLLWLVVIIMRS